MVEIKISKAMYGNNCETGNLTFKNLNEVFDFLINGEHQGFWCTVIKDKTEYFLKKEFNEIKSKEYEKNCGDDVTFYIRTNNYYRDYMWYIERIDVDGVCWLNHIGQYSYKVTNTFIREFFNPLKELVTKEVVYAD